MATLIMTIVIIVAVVLAIVLGIVISKIISVPINKMVTATKKLALGDVDVSVDINTKDEIGILADSFKKYDCKYSFSGSNCRKNGQWRFDR